jgi:hypothetical protein
MKNLSNLIRYADPIQSLSTIAANDMPLPASLLMSESGPFKTYFAPFDHINLQAKIVIVGITPGRVQAIEALRFAQKMLAAGSDLDATSLAAKVAASFSGPMRANLISILDAVGVHEKLSLKSTAALWGDRHDLVHFTSALRYPVFENGKNFSGTGISRNPYLSNQVAASFVEECRLLPNALFVPLGSAAMEGCRIAVDAGALQKTHILCGIPHPSGANAERIAYFLERKAKSALSGKTRADVIELGREEALRIVQGWRLH